MSYWQLVNRRLIAKAIAELSYEQVLKPVEKDDGTFELQLENDVRYSFAAWRTVWDYLRVDSASLVRSPAAELKADQFYLDTRAAHGMSDITLANFLEELYRTLYSDLKSLERQTAFADQDLVSLDDTTLQSLLDGHPKALVNKGRIGWSTEDLGRYSPESAEPFALHWLAVRKGRLLEQFADGLDGEACLAQTMTSVGFNAIKATLSEKGLDDGSYSLMPLHPWQWQEVVPFHFQQELQSGEIVYLGEQGDLYSPQTSLRTLSNRNDPAKLQVKLPVSILNTSCVRGIDGRYIPVAPALSQIVKSICAKDEILEKVVVLGDLAGSFLPQSAYEAIPEAPYRYKEFLGAIFRESPESLLEDGERSLLTAALFHKKPNGSALIADLIERSGLSTEDWLKAYFETVLIPLYHLQLKYGVGLVSHGQNIMISLKGHKPHRLLIKDFQGDLRLLDKDIPELSAFPAEIKGLLTRLPAPYLIHDLLTGHFVTVLRFVSAALQESTGYPEANFYSILSSVIRDYHARKVSPEYQGRIEALGVLKRLIPRVLVNKVRFHIGYGDSALRPVPMVGTDLNNPVYEDLHDSRS